MKLFRITTIDRRRYWVRAVCLRDHGRYPVLLPVCNRRGIATGRVVRRALVDAIR